MITALLELVRRHALDAREVARLRIRVSPATHAAYEHRRDVRGKWEASSSIHYTAAVALQDGYVWLDQFEPARFADPGLHEFIAGRLELVRDPQLEGVQAIVEVTLSDGRRHTLRCDAPKGSPENPMSDAEVQQKFRRAAAGRIAAGSIDAIVESVMRLEKLASVRKLCEQLRAHG